MWYPIARNLLFMLPPEMAHTVSMYGLQNAASIPFLKKQLAAQFQYQGNKLAKTCFGVNFPNPVGLGAGFDKNAAFLDELEMLLQKVKKVVLGSCVPMN